MVFRRALLPLLLAASACSDDGSMPIDAASDAADAPPDVDNGMCGDQVRFTGEYVDWDTQTSFCGIFDATIAVANGGASDTTAPNGRFDLCIPDAPTTRLDVTQPTAASECTQTPSTYTIPTLFIADRAVIEAGAMFSGRAFTLARQDTFFAGDVPAFDATKAQVFVHIDGAARTLSLDASRDPAQTVTGTTWAQGDSGTDVFFPNVDVGGGTTVLSATGGTTIGAGSIPLVAGTITNITLRAP
jgi:hypothetical protein